MDGRMEGRMNARLNMQQPCVLSLKSTEESLLLLSKVRLLFTKTHPCRYPTTKMGRTGSFQDESMLKS